MGLTPWLVLTGFFWSIFSASAQLNNPCTPTRAVIDIGSHFIRLKVARVDACHTFLKETLFQREIPIGIKESIESSGTSSLSTSTIREITEAVATLVELGKQKHKLDPRIYSGATLRSAKNHDQLRIELASRGMELSIITPQQENLAAFFAASVSSSKKIDRILVWDIGGSGINFTFAYSKDRFFTWDSPWGALPFRNLVITEIKKLKSETPNPLTLDQITQATALSERTGRSSLSPEILAKARDPQTHILGMGGVLYHDFSSFRGGANELNRTQMESYLQTLVGKKDSELGGRFSSTKLTNLALAVGFMKVLQIEKIQPISSSLIDGLLLYPDLWIQK